MAASPNIVSTGDAMIFTKDEATAAQRTWMFYLSNSADGTPATGKTIAGADFKISKAGGAFANAVGTVTEVSLGWYKMVFDAGDVDTIGALACELSGEAGVDTLHVVHQVTVLDLNTATVNPGTGGIVAASFGAGAIDAAAIAANAIGTSEFAAATIAAIADAIWDEANAGHVAAGSTGLALSLARPTNVQNVVVDGGDGVAAPTYDSYGMLTAGRIRVFATGTAALAATAGAAAGADSEIASYTVGASGSNGRLGLYRVSDDAT